MSPWVDISLASRSNRPRSEAVSVERLVNVYAEPNEPNSKTPFSLYGDPGLDQWASLSTSVCRGLHVFNGYVWAVVGSTLYAINESTAAVTTVGTVAGSLPVRMTNNDTHVGIAGQPYFYAATLTGLTVVANISDVSSVCFQDGYGILVRRNTDEVYITGLDDMTTVAALDFTTVDAQPDDAIACVSLNREVWVLGGSTTEVLANTGNADFPFSRVQYIARGILSPGSVAIGDGSVVWLGDDKRVYRSSGYTPVPISTSSIERLIADAYSPDTSEAFVYTLEGHTNYVLTFADLTVIFDMTTGLWRERRSFGLKRWRAQHYCRVGADTHIVGDYSNGKLYTLNLDTFDEESEIIERIVVIPPLSDDPNYITVHELFADFEMGVGLTSGQGSAPVALLSASDDGGRSWSNDREVSLGAIGQYTLRAHINRLGRSRNRSHRLRVTDPVKFALHQIRARYEVSAT